MLLMTLLLKGEGVQGSTSRRLVTFSGLDGAGKSTQIELVAASMRSSGYTVVRLWSRGGYTPIFESLKKAVRALSRSSIPKSGSVAKREQTFSRPFVQQ